MCWRVWVAEPSIDAGERGAGIGLVVGTGWLEVAWRMNWSNNLVSSAEAVAVIGSEVTVCCGRADCCCDEQLGPCCSARWVAC